MERLIKPIQIFFSNLFPKLILKNRIVATIIYNIGVKFGQMKDESDILTNTDI
jgi:hypothetical protein